MTIKQRKGIKILKMSRHVSSSWKTNAAVPQSIQTVCKNISYSCWLYCITIVELSRKGTSRLWISCDAKMGDFTFWISLLLRPSLSAKYGLRPKISKKWSRFFSLDSVIAEFKVWSQRSLSDSLRPNFRLSDRWVQTEKFTSLFADLWSQSVFWTQRWSQRKTNPKSKITH